MTGYALKKPPYTILCAVVWEGGPMMPLLPDPMPAFMPYWQFRIPFCDVLLLPERSLLRGGPAGGPRAPRRHAGVRLFQPNHTGQLSLLRRSVRNPSTFGLLCRKGQFFSGRTGFAGEGWGGLRHRLRRGIISRDAGRRRSIEGGLLGSRQDRRGGGVRVG